MALTKRIVLALLLFANLCIANSAEYRVGNFEFDIPGSWEVKASQTEVLATQGDRKPIPNSLLKIELCVSTESQPCSAEMFFPPVGANPENYYCGAFSPKITQHSNGLKEFRKTCSTSGESSTTRIGMLYLSSGHNNLGLMVMTDSSGLAPAEFIELFLSSFAIK